MGTSLRPPIIPELILDISRLGLHLQHMAGEMRTCWHQVEPSFPSRQHFGPSTIMEPAKLCPGFVYAGVIRKTGLLR
jgi:hypothetical protein